MCRPGIVGKLWWRDRQAACIVPRDLFIPPRDSHLSSTTPSFIHNPIFQPQLHLSATTPSFNHNPINPARIKQSSSFHPDYSNCSLCLLCSSHENSRWRWSKKVLLPVGLSGT